MHTQLKCILKIRTDWQAKGDLLSKFGVEIRDQATFIISVRTWERFISLDENLASSFRLNEGDLIYMPLLRQYV